MSKLVLMDTILIHLHVPTALPDNAYRAMRRSLMGPRFGAELRRAVRAVVRQFPALGKIKITITR